MAKMKTVTVTENTEAPLLSPPDGNSNALFAAVTNLNAHMTALHAALPPHTALLLFSGHSAQRSFSTLTARRLEYQTSQNKKLGNRGSTGTDRRKMADDRALEEAVIRSCSS